MRSRRGTPGRLSFRLYNVAHCLACTILLCAVCCTHSGSSRHARRQTAESFRDEGLVVGVDDQAGSWVGVAAPGLEQLPRACPRDCSGRGICDGSVCVCFDGYAGSACESTSEAPPVSEPAPAPHPAPAVAPAPAGAHEGERDGVVPANVDGSDGACPPLTAPGMAGVRCYVRVHPELVPLGIGGGSCFCFIVLIGCAANRGRKRRPFFRRDEDDVYSAADRSSLSDASFDDKSRSRRKPRQTYGV